ncbi:MAG TPA: transporter substrate-binding domain-containing protein, partial [Candidatus Obscuribacterales bacterium]
MPNFLRSRWLQRLVLACGCLLLLLMSHSASVAQSQNILRVGTEPAFPPFEFQSSAGGLQGFDIDLMQAIAQTEGLRVEFQSLPFDGLIPALQARTVDAAISSMTITAERQKTVDFSRPYFKAGLAIAVRTSDTQTTDLASLRNQTIGVQIGTTGAETARQIPGAAIRTFDSAPLALQALLNGNVSAVINDAPVTLYAIKTNNLTGIKVTSQLLTEEFYGIAMPKNSPNLTKINAGLTQILNNGTYRQIYRKWLNAEPPELATVAPNSPDAQPGTTAPVDSGTVITRSLPILLQGALITLELTALSVLLGLVGGTLMGLARLSAARPLR